ncbi:hypothetical protein [Umboniibacter marinipuniceus]|uniref:HTH araC/xylS-type domain-containing protein n=1 Tax=Umboniibacter marinipuniceus TaxID=569599 RepID=A0A3M0A4L1_9GAMM|nr:hypothetical protein [Umboniibacter marinipuniceus]RMA79973.1 hypothetical protein DFR27_1329 [Umboniibacter marinipuniceus]
MFEFRSGWLDLVSCGAVPRLILNELRRQGIDDSVLYTRLSISAAEFTDLDRPWCFKELNLLLSLAQSHTGQYLIFSDPVDVARRLAIGKARLGAHYAEDFRGAVGFLAESSQSIQRYIQLSVEESDSHVDLVLSPTMELGGLSAFLHFLVLLTTMQMLKFLAADEMHCFDATLSGDLVGSAPELSSQSQLGQFNYGGNRTFIRYSSALQAAGMSSYDLSRFTLAKCNAAQSRQLDYCQMSWGDKTRVVLMDSNFSAMAQDVAAEFGLTAKTFSHYLSREGLTFKELKGFMVAEREVLSQVARDSQGKHSAVSSTERL